MKKVFLTLGLAVGAFTLFSFYEVDKVEATIESTSEYPEVDFYTYYDDFESFYSAASAEMDYATSLVESTGHVHGFPVTSEGGIYGIGATIDLEPYGTTYDPALHFSGTSAQFENRLSADPCAWLNSFGSLFTFSGNDC